MLFPVLGTTVAGSVFKGLRDFSEFNAKVQFWYKVSFFIVPLCLLFLFGFFYKGKNWMTFAISFLKSFALATGLLVGCFFLIDYLSLPIIIIGALAAFASVFGFVGSRYASVSLRLQLVLLLVAGFISSLYVLGHVMMARSAGIGPEAIRNSIVTQYVAMLFHVIWYAIFIGTSFYQQLYILNKKR